MSKMGFNASYYKLEDYYMSKLLERIHGSIDKDIKTYVWQEVFDNKVEVSDSRVCVTMGRKISFLKMARCEKLTRDLIKVRKGAKSKQYVRVDQVDHYYT